MFKDNRGLVEDVVSLRNKLRLTEKNLQSLGEQLSQSGNDIIAEDNDRSGADAFPGHLTLEDLQKPNTGQPGGYPLPDRTAEQRTCACDCRPVRDMETEMSVLTRKVNSIRQENSSLVMENKLLINDLEATQLELASSKSKIRVLGSTAGARTSSVSLMKEQVLGLETELNTQTRALEAAEQKLEASEQTVMLSNRLVEKLRDELRVVKAELAERTRLGKRAEQQRNQALRNAEKLTVAFEDYKEDVSEKLMKVMESEDQLKVSLMECDREREELDRKCAALEREKESLCQNISELKEVHGCSESLSAERVQLQYQVQQFSDQLKQLQREQTEKEAQLQEVAALRRENEDLRLLTACQEQRVVQANREREQDRAELTSLESIVDLLHLRENREGALCVNPCLLPSLSYTSTIEHKTGECYQKLLAVLQMAEREKTRQASAAQGLQERLTRAQEEISSLQTSITERSSHYQQLHNQLLDKATQATSFEKELKKKSSHVVVLEKQLQEKSAAYSQAAIKASQLEQELLEKASRIQHYQSVLNKKQREYQQTIDKSKTAQSHKCKEMEDRIEVLQLSLVQKQTEIGELEQHVSDLQTEKLESQQRAALLQTTIDQLTEDFKAKCKHSKETRRNIEEQAANSVSKLSELQEELKRKCLAYQRSNGKNLQLQHSIKNQHTMLQESTSRIAQLEESQSQLQSQRESKGTGGEEL
ncbi:coiled-coil domain-containing protein 18-like isoform X2 [Myxocyprinus asiaticus]|uniref:coiled-coil domain-containing protein 18-like isoform X2 n=1 Tax=Myxocyprinus asiaticus TaxID=70543 RepID=UPI002222AA9A|nr:coiled-coil domain-containing protein 18-like isoform X2 [Myxocyprinus asiaticus]